MLQVASLLAVLFGSTFGYAQGPDPEYYAVPCNRTITADVVALDQVIIYNRFGAVDRHGMIFALSHDVIPRVAGTAIAPGNVRLRNNKRPRPLALRANVGDCLQITLTNLLSTSPSPVGGGGTNNGTRTVAFHVNGLEPTSPASEGLALGVNGASALAATQSSTFTYYCTTEGQFAFHSPSSSIGGEGAHGAIARGLFGAVTVQPQGSTWYRSQVNETDLALATTGINPNGTPQIDYNATDASGKPIFKILDDNLNTIHSDLTAIVVPGGEDCIDAPPSSTCGDPYREFVIIFHDEIGITQAYPVLQQDKLYAGVRDAFAINYGTGGLGAPVIANRMGEGPARNCGECKFEEFFLESWANGDPAMPVTRNPVSGVVESASFPDDPSNVYHSYLGDSVRFRNLHMGSETHVFHLHAHQWLFEPRNPNSTYLDSQSISPGSSYTYEINYNGSGNRNKTPGDSIFHCHLYPHFAEGMWSLWRTHDVFEDGSTSRNLPDGEITQGTPVPGIVPLPGTMMPPMPTAEFPGFPHYIAGEAGHRAPQPPLEMVHDGGLQRHRIKSSTVIDGEAGIAAKYLIDPVHQRVKANDPHPAKTGWSRVLESAEIELLPPNGTALEVAAQDFHSGTLGNSAVDVTDSHNWPGRGYPSFDSSGNAGLFLVNGRAPIAGAPFADPCPDQFIDGNGLNRSVATRTYKAAYIQFDMTINELGWHDRQARIAVLNEDVMPTLNGTRAPEPLFFRANSGECIVFESTNLMPSNLNLDDFQIFTPTDIIGQHIHLVKFDVTSSDGSANGWNYEDGTFSPEEVRERIHANNVWQTTNNSGQQLLSAETHPVFGPGTNDEWVGAQTTVQRWWADPLVNNQGEDRTIRSVFTHDHFGPSSHQQHGLYALLVVEPTDSIWTYPNGNTMLGTRADGGPTSWAANILAGVQGADSMREFVFETGEWMPVYDGANNPINAPRSQTQDQTQVDGANIWPNMSGMNNPEAISMGGGAQTINYRNDPPTRGGEEGSAANSAFDSSIYGDPFTPLARAYEGDNVKISISHGAQEEFHTFTVNGNRWLQEGSNPNSGFTNMQFYGISEHFEMYFKLGDGLRHTAGSHGATDYMYLDSVDSGAKEGIWGIMRAYHEAESGLSFLPNNSGTTPRPQHPLQSGLCPTGPGSPPIRQVHIQAWRAADLLGGAGLVYNDRFTVFDPNGMLYIHEEDMIPFMTGQKEVDPLVIRANAGECIEVTLTNMLPAMIQPGFGTPRLNGFESVQTTVGLSPQLVAHDVGTGSSSNVGWNPDSLAGPGETKQYAWYAGSIDAQPDGSIQYNPIEFGMTNLRSFGDVFNHHKHGLFGSLVIEPEGSQWFYDYLDGNGYVEARSGYEADVLDQDGLLLFREYVLQVQDSFPLLRKGQLNQQLDDKQLENLAGYNYRTEPTWLRMGVNSSPPWVQQGSMDHTNVFSSTAGLIGCANLPCLDPATPGCDAEAGTMVMFRVGQSGGKNNGHAFGISGHSWQRQPFADNSTRIGLNPQSMGIGASGPIAAQSHKNILIKAGGEARSAGTYMYRMTDSFAFTGGCWGLLKVDPYVRIPAQPVAALSCAALPGTGVQLNWTNAGIDYLTVELYRNGQLLSVMPGSISSYLDEIAVPGIYTYAVVAVNQDLPSTETSCSATVTPPAPGAFACTPENIGALLVWENQGLYDEVVVMRDGLPVGRLPGDQTSHTDPVNPGQYFYSVIGVVNLIEAPSGECALVLVPTPPVISPAVVVDPCAHIFNVSWSNSSVTTSIVATLDGVVLENLPGEATSMSVTLSGLGTQQLCLTPVANGVNGPASCIDITAAGIASSSPTSVAISIDPATYIATLSWDSTTEMDQWQVTVDGVEVAVLGATTLECSIPVVNSGLFTACVGGITLCGDVIVATCGEATAPQRFQRGDSNANGNLDLGDVINTLNIVFGGAPSLCLDAADATDDGAIDITDAISLINYLFADGAAPAAPSGECGADLTADTLDCTSSTNCP